MENYRFCTNPDCGERYLNLKRKCDICEQKVVKNLNETNVFSENQISSGDNKYVCVYIYIYIYTYIYILGMKLAKT